MRMSMRPLIVAATGEALKTPASFSFTRFEEESGATLLPHGLTLKVRCYKGRACLREAV